jgi:hypothetical protein
MGQPIAKVANALKDANAKPTALRQINVAAVGQRSRRRRLESDDRKTDLGAMAGTSPAIAIAVFLLKEDRGQAGSASSPA